MMSSPVLSPPTLFTPADLKSKTTLLDNITELINDAFTRSKGLDPEKWEGAHRKRFPTLESYFEMLGEEGIITAIFDHDRIVAVAAAVPWTGGWKKEGAGVEKGWEIKAVAVHGDTKYLHRGLAVQLYTSLEQYLIQQERTKILKTKEVERAMTGHVSLWILAAECINGAYWRKRGYREVRRDTCGPSTWGCLTSFEMVVLQKELTFDLRSN
ncbi:hypothetical protein PMIN06_002348 [Paraphaeosphaeria minitans]|uniref:N-acetyltransferase domain-containing protein n=1 Tax=Paraphaeosphaeria minitans TaxID=565426 RepID=A0A9P6GMD5_9PLEO|nr:hypothetical protein PMIN01_05507 [Paraphaeosphaeria minitans]